jgi:branched-chain amino acid transport system ATP-binding protein
LLIILKQRRFTLASKNILEVQDLNVHYGASHALHNICFEVKEGHLLALMGRNGAGKTTTLMTLSGLLKSTSGAFRLRGSHLEHKSPEFIAKNGVRLVPQGRRLFASLSVLENLMVGEQKIERRALWTKERVYEMFPVLRVKKNQRASTLSGGEQQMLAIGRALMGNPEVLLLDEPSEGLAPITLEEVNQSIAKLKDEGLSIILVEQNFSTAKSLADDFVILNAGLVACVASADQIKLNPELATQHLGIS